MLVRLTVIFSNFCRTNFCQYIWGKHHFSPTSILVRRQIQNKVIVKKEDDFLPLKIEYSGAENIPS